jgi:hypothetical protein
MPAVANVATALDPTRLFRAAGLEPDPWQRRLLLEPWDRALLNITRQGGKSLTVAALALHTVLFRSDALVLVLAPARRQSKELLRKAWSLYQAAGRPMPVDNRSELRARFENGSRMIALPGTEETIRGFSAVDLIVADEAARVDDELYGSVRPMLAVSEGRLVGLSTPWGKRGWFYEAWTDETQDWHRVKHTAEECPRLSEEFLRQEKREIGRWMYRQEYLCQFVDPVNQMFRTSEIEGAFDSDVDPLFDGREEGLSAGALGDPIDTEIDSLEI